MEAVFSFAVTKTQLAALMDGDGFWDLGCLEWERNSHECWGIVRDPRHDVDEIRRNGLGSRLIRAG
jgi:hypothetical protein